MQFPHQYPMIGNWDPGYSEDLLILWSEIFGTKIRSALEDPEHVLKIVVDRAQAILGRFNAREGEICLFLRDPVTDRLILERSTVPCLNPGSEPPPTQLFQNMGNNYDPSSRTAFYDLYDRLASESDKRSESSRILRGLTGWVAVTGHSLLINNQEDLLNLSTKLKNNPYTQSSCVVYGMPKWGKRVSEFPYEDYSKWIKHYIAVPIKSISNPSCTIGVLRYACSWESPELDESDLRALNWVAQIISNVRNLDYEKSVHDRNKSLKHQIDHLRKTGNLRSFLSFMAISLRSEIASVYVAIPSKDEQKLRLLEAIGISGNVGELRMQGVIEDYSSERTGLTWKLYESFQNRVKVYSSVGDDTDWTGRNTVIFYKNALAKLGFGLISEQLKNPSLRGAIVRSYSIKLMGIGLTDNNVPIGVLKVEFPSDFDSILHYNDEDRQFFQDCADVIKEELSIYVNIINGKWFEKHKHQNVETFVRIVGCILQNRLIDQNSHFQFWEKTKTFAKNHYQSIKVIDDKILVELNIEESRLMTAIKNLGRISLRLFRRWWMFL
ncbi:MAG: hypothetical protein AB7T38_18290 [Nitrospirales bacterium]